MDLLSALHRSFLKSGNRIRDLEGQVSWLQARCEYLRRLEIDPLGRHLEAQERAVAEEQAHHRRNGIGV